MKIGYRKIYVDNELLIWKVNEGPVNEQLFRGKEDRR